MLGTGGRKRARRRARPNPSRRTLSQNGNDSRAQVCVEPSGNGVTLTTRVANQTAIQQTIVADGVERPDHRRGVPWHATRRVVDGWPKIYSQADLACSNDKGNRRVSGFSILGRNGTWTDIQAVDVSGQQTVRVRSYRRVSEVAKIGPRLTHASPLTLDDVKEASTKVSARTSKRHWSRPARRSICPARISSRFRTPRSGQRHRSDRRSLLSRSVHRRAQGTRRYDTHMRRSSTILLRWMGVRLSDVG